MATIDDLDEDFILCNVCNVEYDENQRSPKLMPCLHTLCNDCTLNSVRGSVLKCAICEEEQSVPNNLEFIKDSTMRNMMDLIRIQKKPASILCSDCPDNERGETFCKDCYVFLCRECTNAHKRTQVTRRHIVLSLDELKNSGIGSFSRKEMCPVSGHDEQPFSFYCDSQDCHKPVCTQCVVSDHSQNDGHVIRNLNEVYEESKHLVERLVGELLHQISDASSSAKRLEAEATDIDNKRTEVQSQIDDFFTVLEDILKLRKEKMKERVEVICEERKTKLNEKLVRMQGRKSDMENSCNYSSRMLVFTNKPEFLQLKDTVVSKLNKLSSSEPETSNMEPMELGFVSGIEPNKFEEFVKNVGELQTNMFDESRDKRINGNATPSEKLKLPYKGPPMSPPGKFTSNKYPVVSTAKRSAPKVEPLKLDGLINDTPAKSYSPEVKGYIKGNKISPTEENVLGRPLSLKSPVITTTKQPTSLGEFLNELTTKSRLFLSNREEAQEDAEPERRLPQTPTSASIGGKRFLATPPPTSLSPPPAPPPPTPTYQQPSPKLTSPTTAKFGYSPMNGSVSSPGTNASHINKTSATLRTAPRTTTTETSVNGDVNGNESFFNRVAKANKASTLTSSPRAPVLTEKSYPDIKPTSPRKTTTSSDKPVTFGDVTCPVFELDGTSAHHEREVSSDGRTLRNKKTEISYGSGSGIDIENSLVQYKGAIGTIPFKDPGKFYYEVDVVYNIQQPLEETWLVFEIGICRLDDVDMHHTVERHEHARSFYVARFPEDGKLAQEFWHNRDLLNVISLSDNTSGIEVRITYGLLVDTKRKKWIIVDCNNNKVLHTFDDLNFSEALHPVFGCYNPDLCTVEITIKTGTEISMIPQCLKAGYRSP